MRATVDALAAKSALALALGRRAYYAMASMDPRASLEYAQSMLVTMLHATESERSSR